MPDLPVSDNLLSHVAAEASGVEPHGREILQHGGIDTLVGTPSHKGSLDPETQDCIDQLWSYNVQNGNPIQFNRTMGSIIGENRNNVLKNAIKAKAKYVLFVDSDMIFPKDAIQRMQIHGKPIISGLAFTKTIPYAANMYRKVSESGWIPISKFKRGHLLQVDCVGGAFMLVEVDAIKDIKPPWFAAPPMKQHVVWEELEKLFTTTEDREKIIERATDLYRTAQNLRSSLGEDYYFCELLRQAGVPIYVDTSLQIGHMGRYMFGYADFAAQLEAGAFDTQRMLYDDG